MGRFTVGINVAEGFSIQARQPADSRVDYSKLSDIITNFETGGDMQYHFYEGLIVTVVQPEIFGGDKFFMSSKFARYIWMESDYGAIPGGFTYGNNVWGGGVEYSSKTFNLVLLSKGINVTTTLDAITSELYIPNKFIPLHVTNGKVADVSIVVDTDTENTLPNSVVFDIDNMVINFKPAYPVGTYLNIKIS